jgi:gas vesicle protein
LKKPDVAALLSAAEELAKAGDPQAGEVTDRVKAFREQWDQLNYIVQNRIRLAQAYVAFHKKAQQVRDYSPT